jgi:hypothetical protein
MAGLSVAVISLDGTLRTYVLLIVLSLCLAVMAAEMGLSYYGGIDYESSELLPKSNKVKPMMNEAAS